MFNILCELCHTSKAFDCNRKMNITALQPITHGLYNTHLLSIIHHRFKAEVLPIRPKTSFNESISTT